MVRLETPVISASWPMESSPEADRREGRALGWRCLPLVPTGTIIPHRRCEDAEVTGAGSIRVFVYGTLMPGHPRWRHLSPYAVSWQPATAAGRLWDTGRGYPAATFDDVEGEIPGVAVLLAADAAEAAMRLLDGIEGEGSLYRRVEIATSHGKALSYEWLGATDGFRPLPDGWPPVDSPHSSA
jgi:gamma-glutamylcyclotransferase (GGCT)/AIG2-like uncharacterized protein YtfP